MVRYGGAVIIWNDRVLGLANPPSPPKNGFRVGLELWQILVLAVVQGVAEFLPISSSGHVVIVAALLAGGDPRRLDVAEVNVVLHVGTLFSILVFYSGRIARLLFQDRHVLGRILIATVPGVMLGLAIKKLASGALESPMLAGAMLLVTGSLLIWAARQRRGERVYPSLTIGQALLIGVAQAAAILPGLSRSGATISTGLRLGLAPTDAATFSFLMAIPIIAGGGAYELLSMMRNQSSVATPVEHLLAGGVVSFVVGWAALGWLVRWLEQGRFQQFAWWCIPVGFVVLAWQAFCG
jgi:undecaprenyl-diphosphatase